MSTKIIKDKNNRPFHITDNFTEEDKKDWYMNQLNNLQSKVKK